MEKITKEELLKNLGGKALDDDMLENVSGGKSFAQLSACFTSCKGIDSNSNNFNLTACLEDCLK